MSTSNPKNIIESHGIANPPKDNKDENMFEFVAENRDFIKSILIKKYGGKKNEDKR